MGQVITKLEQFPWLLLGSCIVDLEQVFVFSEHYSNEFGLVINYWEKPNKKLEKLFVKKSPQKYNIFEEISVFFNNKMS